MFVQMTVSFEVEDSLCVEVAKSIGEMISEQIEEVHGLSAEVVHEKGVILCKHCGELKSLDDYNLRKPRVDGEKCPVARVCKTCWVIKNTEDRKRRNPVREKQDSGNPKRLTRDTMEELGVTDIRNK